MLCVVVHGILAHCLRAKMHSFVFKHVLNTNRTKCFRKQKANYFDETQFSVKLFCIADASTLTLFGVLFTFEVVLFIINTCHLHVFHQSPAKNHRMNYRKEKYGGKISTGQSFQVRLSVYLPVWVKYNGPESPSSQSSTPHCLVIRPKVGMVIDSDS